MNWRAAPRRAFPYLIAAAGGFLLSYTAIFLFAFPAEVLPDDGILPNVVGKTYEDAAARLSAAGFPAQQGESRFHKSIPPNIVLQQDPPAGSRQKRGTNVVLALSAGQKTAEVPVTTNMSQQQARIAIENTGLTMGNVSEQLAEQPRGLVIANSPADEPARPVHRHFAGRRDEGGAARHRRHRAQQRTRDRADARFVRPQRRRSAVDDRAARAQDRRNVS